MSAEEHKDAAQILPEWIQTIPSTYFRAVDAERCAHIRNSRRDSLWQ